MANENILLQVNNLKKYFKTAKGQLHAVDDISFTLEKGKTLGVVGESGCGKSTLGRTVIRLLNPTSGQVLYKGTDLATLSGEEMRKLRQAIQIIFQDPYSSLSPRLPVGEIIGEAVREHNLVPKSEYADYVTKIMDDCGLQSYHKDRYPHEFSGGQRQRICIARALALNPEFVVCDEPVSALDVSVQAQILNLLGSLQRERGLAYLLITHNFAVVEHAAHRVAVMQGGRIVEEGAAAAVLTHPKAAYTKRLLASVPRL